MGRRRAAVIAALVLLGAVYRIAAWRAMPVAHDEVSVMAYGFLKGTESLRAFLFGAPATVSNGVTPLWAWLQSIPMALFGSTTKPGLRLLPFVLGLLTIPLVHRAGERAGGSRAGLFAGLLQAAMSVVLYANGRGEFSESLLAPLLVLLLLDLLPCPDGGPVPWRAALWPALILFTYAGKGALVWAAYAFALALVWLLGRLGRVDRSRVTTPRLLWMAAAPWVPTILWMLAANTVVFGRGPVLTDLGPASSIWQVFRMLTIGYGVETKTFMVGGWLSALYVYTDFEVWPLLAVVAVPAVCAIAALSVSAFRAAGRGERAALESAIVPLALILPIAGALVAKGAFSSRFHLLYLPILLPYIGAALDSWCRAFERRRWGLFLGGGAAACLYVAWSASWSNRFAGTHDAGRFALVAITALAALAILAIASSFPAVRLRAAIVVTGALLVVLIVCSSLFGLLDWGRRLAWEPELRPTTPALLATLPNPDLQLARFALEREMWLESAGGASPSRDVAENEVRKAAVVARLRPILMRALERHPEDEATLVEAGGPLWQYSARDREGVVARWRDYARAHPGSAAVQNLIDRASGSTGAP